MAKTLLRCAHMNAMPPGLQPCLLTREQAAMYVARSAWGFDQERKADIWPPPIKLPGRQPRWDRLQLDKAVEVLGGTPQAMQDEISRQAVEAIRYA